MGGAMDRHRRALSTSGARAVTWLLPAAFLALFFVFPLVAIADRGLRPDGVVDLGPLGRVLGDPDLRGVAWFTAWQAAVSTLLTLAVGVPAAFVLSRFAFRGRRLIRALALVPFVLPTVVVGTAFVGWLGPGSPAAAVVRWFGVDTGDGLHRSVGAIVGAHVFFNIAVILRVVGSYWDQVDPSVEESAEGLGADRFQVVRRVLIPVARPAIASAAALVFLFSFTSFGVVQILGDPSTATLEVEIYRHTSQLLDLPTAAVLALLQMVFVTVLLVGESMLAARSGVPLSLVSGGAARPPRDRVERLAVVIVVVGLGLLLAAPLMALIWRSLGSFDLGLGSARIGPTLEHFTGLGQARRGSVFSVAPLASIGRSFATATAAATAATLVGVPASFAIARSRRSAALGVLVALPLGISAVTVGFGYVVAFDDAPLDLRGSWWIVPLAQAVVALPFVVRIVTPVLVSIGSGPTDAAADLGAPPLGVTTRVIMPIARPAIAAGAGFAFIVALGEFGAATFLASPDGPTMPVAIARLLAQPGSASLGRAAAMSVVLMIVTALGALAVDRIVAPAAREPVRPPARRHGLLAWVRAYLAPRADGDPDRRRDLARRHRDDQVPVDRS
jgi:thiamine transport system permease protein